MHRFCEYTKRCKHSNWCAFHYNLDRIRSHLKSVYVHNFEEPWCDIKNACNECETSCNVLGRAKPQNFDLKVLKSARRPIVKRALFSEHAYYSCTFTLLSQCNARTSVLTLINSALCTCKSDARFLKVVRWIAVIYACDLRPWDCCSTCFI